jgi:hypothetical protein
MTNLTANISPEGRTAVEAQTGAAQPVTLMNSSRKGGVLPSSNRPVLVLGGLSLVTAVAHGAVIDEHLQEFAPFGIFFALVAAAELAWAGAVVGRPGPQTTAGGVALNLGLITLWVVSRTLGLPIGPQAAVAEPVGHLDLLCTIAEVAIVVALSAFPAMPAAGAPTEQGERPAGVRLSIDR